MQDKEIREAFNIPTQTLHQWKGYAPEDWRSKIYTFFKIQEKEEIAPVLDRVNKILESRAKTAN